MRSLGLFLVVFWHHVFFSSEARADRNPSHPFFTQSMHNLTLAVGKEAVLTCTVENLGRHKVAWVRAEDQTILSLETKVVTHNSRITVSEDKMRIWELRIKQLKESDRGCYMCQINTSNIRSQQGCIDVQVPPDIMDNNTSGDVSVTEGDNVTLWCKATGHPPPRVIWRREDHQPMLVRRGRGELEKVDTYNGSNLYLLRADRRQMGAYLCIASNDVPPAVSKRISLNVNFMPSVKVPNQLLGAPQYTDVILECYVEAYPNTINYWVRSRQEMLLNNSKYFIREEKHNYRTYMWLQIKNFSIHDVGTYNCISTNSLGKAEGTLRVYEIKVNNSEIDKTRMANMGVGVAEAAKGRSSGSLLSLQLSIALTYMVVGAMALYIAR